jgi:hypothetical protein
LYDSSLHSLNLSTGCLLGFGFFRPWPLAEPRYCREWLKQSQGKEEIENIRYAIKKIRPYSSEKWVSKAVAEFALEKHDAESRPPEKSFLTPFS